MLQPPFAFTTTEEADRELGPQLSPRELLGRWDDMVTMHEQVFPFGSFSTDIALPWSPEEAQQCMKEIRDSNIDTLYYILESGTHILRHGLDEEPIADKKYWPVQRAYQFAIMQRVLAGAKTILLKGSAGCGKTKIQGGQLGIVTNTQLRGQILHPARCLFAAQRYWAQQMMSDEVRDRVCFPADIHELKTLAPLSDCRRFLVEQLTRCLRRIDKGNRPNIDFEKAIKRHDILGLFGIHKGRNADGYYENFAETVKEGAERLDIHLDELGIWHDVYPLPGYEEVRQQFGALCSRNALIFMGEGERQVDIAHVRRPDVMSPLSTEEILTSGDLTSAMHPILFADPQHYYCDSMWTGSHMDFADRTQLPNSVFGSVSTIHRPEDPLNLASRDAFLTLYDEAGEGGDPLKTNPNSLVIAATATKSDMGFDTTLPVYKMHEAVNATIGTGRKNGRSRISFPPHHHVVPGNLKERIYPPDSVETVEQMIEELKLIFQGINLELFKDLGYETPLEGITLWVVTPNNTRYAVSRLRAEFGHLGITFASFNANGKDRYSLPLQVIMDDDSSPKFGVGSRDILDITWDLRRLRMIIMSDDDPSQTGEYTDGIVGRGLHSDAPWILLQQRLRTSNARFNRIQLHRETRDIADDKIAFAHQKRQDLSLTPCQPISGASDVKRALAVIRKNDYVARHVAGPVEEGRFKLPHPGELYKHTSLPSLEQQRTAMRSVRLRFPQHSPRLHPQPKINQEYLALFGTLNHIPPDEMEKIKKQVLKSTVPETQFRTLQRIAYELLRPTPIDFYEIAMVVRQNMGLIEPPAEPEDRLAYVPGLYCRWITDDKLARTLERVEEEQLNMEKKVKTKKKKTTKKNATKKTASNTAKKPKKSVKKKVKGTNYADFTMKREEWRDGQAKLEDATEQNESETWESLVDYGAFEDDVISNDDSEFLDAYEIYGDD